MVGIGCRFAGGIGSPAEFWEFLSSGGSAVRALSEGRWSGQGEVLGSFLDDIAGFDAELFGIPPREARLIDPQHRLALEVSWEALEHAGISPTSLRGRDTGVFVGIGADDYGRRTLSDLARIEPWTGIGASMCGAANRISHSLDLRGPSVAVDTACSSSLVAVHQAIQSLWLGETDLALAGGVLLVAAPGLGAVLDAAGATSPDGRSKPFAVEADGYGRGEGCAFVVLKLLRDAVAAGDRVLAVLRGGAVCQDGRTEGIMAPSASAQVHLMRPSACGTSTAGCRTAARRCGRSARGPCTSSRATPRSSRRSRWCATRSCAVTPS
ncbi:hypothetical protein Lesp01_04430 [Lentzea sp. NBRC 102530]|nr:hypothetical protein Lesp01_04430 [Lentzea sp. NBRC 102530]